MAKKQPIKKTEIKPKQNQKFVIPKQIKSKLNLLKQKYYKDDDDSLLFKDYEEAYNKTKEKYADKQWNDLIYHKRTLTKIKNRKKRERLGGTLSRYIGIYLGNGNVRDLLAKRRSEIMKKWEDDPDDTMNEGLIITKNETNPTTGEEEKVPLLDKEGNPVPRDNREFFKRKDGSKFRNTNFNHAIGHSYQRNGVAILQNKDDIIGVAIVTLRDKITELDIPINVPIEIYLRNNVKDEATTMLNNKYYSKEYIEDLIEAFETDHEMEEITDETYNTKIKHYKSLLKEKEVDVNIFRLVSNKNTKFSVIEDEELIESINLPKNDYGSIDIDKVYKKYLTPFSCDCSNLLKYHLDNRYIDDDPNKVNWDEFVSLQDVNLLQIKTEASLSGNYTCNIDDDSFFHNEIVHNEETIDSVRILIPSHIDIEKFGIDSKINLVGNVGQFQSQDDDGNLIYESEIDEKGKEIKIPVYDYPVLFVYGIFVNPDYDTSVDTIDTTEEGYELKEKGKTESIDEEEIEDNDETEESDEETDDEIEDIVDSDEEIKEEDIW